MDFTYDVSQAFLVGRNLPSNIERFQIVAVPVCSHEGAALTIQYAVGDIIEHLLGNDPIQNLALQYTCAAQEVSICIRGGKV